MAGIVLPMAASVACGASLAAGSPHICDTAIDWGTAGSGPAEVVEYIETLGPAPFDQRAACARWAGIYSSRRGDRLRKGHAAQAAPARLILFPSAGHDVRQLATALARSAHVRHFERAREYVIVQLAKHLSGDLLQEILATPEIGYAEPDCDGPDFRTTSTDLMTTGIPSNC